MAEKKRTAKPKPVVVRDAPAVPGMGAMKEHPGGLRTRRKAAPRVPRKAR